MPSSCSASISERGVTTRDLCPLAARIFAHGATPEAAAVAECEVERRLIVPDLDVVALLGHLRDAGKLIVAVSDTYFSASDIRAFLTQPGAGNLELDRIYVSSEYRVNKGGDSLRPCSTIWV